MSKKNDRKNTWVNQSALGIEFGVSAVAIGRKLQEAGLRAGSAPTKAARQAGLVTNMPLRDGTPNYRWHKTKTMAALQAAGLVRQSPEAVREAKLRAEAKELARDLRHIREENANYSEKLECIFWDTMPKHLLKYVEAELGEDY